MGERPSIKNDVIYSMVIETLSDKKLESMDAVEGTEGESHISDEVRRALALEMSIRILMLMKLNRIDAREQEADVAIANIMSSSSLAEAKARAIWHRRNIR